MTLPLGYRAAGIYCGIKRNTSKLDMSLIVSERAAVAAGVYTQNLVFAAPVAWNRAITPAADIRAVVINSGNANACTGQRGWDDAQAMARAAAATCQASEKQCLVLSTGIIGSFLPMDKILPGIAAAAGQLGDSEDHFLAAVRGMLTTDTVHKVSTRQIDVAGRKVRVTGMAKGAAMIGPNMATMLSVILTDAALEPATAQRRCARRWTCRSIASVWTGT